MSRPSNDSAQQNLVTVAGIAQALAVSRSMIYKWVEEGIIPHYRFGKAIRFDVSEIKEWLKTKSVRSASISESNNEDNQNNATGYSVRDSRPSQSENLELDVDRILKSSSIGGGI